MGNVKEKEIINKSNKYKFFHVWQDPMGKRNPCIIIECSTKEYYDNKERDRIIEECGLNTIDYDISFKENYDS